MLFKTTAGCQISNFMFEKKCGGGSLLISHEKYIKNGNIFAHLALILKVITLKVLSGSLTDVSA